MIRLCAPTDEVAESFFAAISVMKDMRVNLAEIRGILGKNVLKLTDEEAKYCYNILKDNGIKVWAISSPVAKCDINISDEDYLKQCKRAIDMAKLFHTNIIRVFSFFNAYEKRDEVIRKLRIMVDLAKKENILVSHENEKGGYGDTPERVIDLLDNVPGLVCNYDAANFIQTGVDSIHSLNLLFPRCYYVHFKDGIHKNDDAEITPVGEGSGNIPTMLKMIKDDKVLSLEHHLRFIKNDQNETLQQIKKDNKFAYYDTTEAFIDSVKYARKVLKDAGYREVGLNQFDNK